MATLNPIKGDLTAGVAAQSSDIITAQEEALVTGDAPAQSWMLLPAAAAQTFTARQVVGLNGSGKLIPAVLGTTQAIGFVVYAPGAATVLDQMVSVMRQGVFNPNLLTFDATYNTAEKKRLAFEGAASPTSIILRAPETMTAV
jgi:hypothetical protein